MGHAVKSFCVVAGGRKLHSRAPVGIENCIRVHLANTFLIFQACHASAMRSVTSTPTLNLAGGKAEKVI
jgi:hypothetical protein